MNTSQNNSGKKSLCDKSPKNISLKFQIRRKQIYILQGCSACQKVPVNKRNLMISIIRSINLYIVWDLPKTFNFCDKLIRQMYLKLEVANIEICIVHQCNAYQWLPLA